MAKGKGKDEAAEKKVYENADDLIADLVVDLRKDYGVEAMTLEGSEGVAEVSAWIPSGAPNLDAVLGNGWPCGRIVELYGAESHGKTTVALHIIAETQKLGGIGIFLDTEHALNKSRAKAIGVDLSRMIYTQPETMEDVFEYIEAIIEKIRQKDPNRLVTIVWDSVAATPTKAEVDADYGETGFLDHSRVMSQAFRKINGLIEKNKILLVCINQIRDKIGVSFGDKTSTFGGRALKFYAAVRLEVVRIGQYKEGDDIAGIQCQATAKKNKVAPPFGVAKFPILFDSKRAGINPYIALLEEGFEMGLFGSSKGYYEIEGKKLRKAQAEELFRENTELYQTFVDTYLSMAVK